MSGGNLRERLRTSTWSGSKTMSNKSKSEKEKELAGWKLALDVQEKRMLEGVQDICNKMGKNLKQFMQLEMDEIKKDLNTLKKDMQMTTQKIQKTEINYQDAVREIQQLKDENKILQTFITALEIKDLECNLRFKGMPEDKDENIFEVVVDKLVNLLREQVENISYNFEDIYRVNSNYASQKKLPKDVVVQMISRKI